MKVSPISWQNHSTCPRLDMSGLAWKFNNFSLRLFVKMQNIKSLRFLPVLPIVAVEAWQNQLGIRPFLFRIKLQFFQHFYVFCWGKSVTFESSNKNAKFSIFEPGRNGKVEETWIQSVNIYQVIPAENSDQIKNNIIIVTRTRTTFFRQPTRLFILFRCSFSPFPSLPARIPTLDKSCIADILDFYKY